MIEPNILHQPHVDEWLVGYRRQLPGQFSVDVSTMRREFRDNVDGLDVNSIYINGVFMGYKDVTQNQITKVVNNEWNWLVYRAIEDRDPADPQPPDACDLHAAVPAHGRDVSARRPGGALSAAQLLRQRQGRGRGRRRGVAQQPVGRGLYRVPVMLT